MSKIKPILFSTLMVKVIREGRKTQTRRIVKGGFTDWVLFMGKSGYEDWVKKPIKLPIEKGDILWVREAFNFNENAELDGKYCYRSDYEKPFAPWEKGCWKPSLFMPKDAARFFLEVTNVRIERLVDISEEDAISEGVLNGNGETQESYLYLDYETNKVCLLHARNSFKSLWNKINGLDSWNTNPWVWVYDFKVIERPENF